MLIAAASRTFFRWEAYFLDHLDAGAAVLRDLVNVRAFHEAQADIGVAQAVSRAGLPLAVLLQSLFFEDRVEELPLEFRKDAVRGLRLVPLRQPLEGRTAPLMLLQ
jgi:hypothetical protein